MIKSKRKMSKGRTKDYPKLMISSRTGSVFFMVTDVRGWNVSVGRMGCYGLFTGDSAYLADYHGKITLENK